MLRKILLLPLLILFALSGQAQTKTLKYNTRVNDNINGYFEYLPVNYNDVPAKNFPLFIYLQGTGTAGDGSPGVLEYVVNSGWGTPPWRAWRDYLPTSFTVDPDGQQREFVLITPQFEVEPYQSHTEVRDVEDLINYCISNYNIDTNRIYLAGQSGGGAYVMEYISNSPRNANRIAAALGSSEAIFATQDEANIIAEANLPLWLAASEFDIYDPDDLTLLQRMATSWITAINNAPNAPNPTFIGPKLTIIPGKQSHNRAATYLYDPATKENGMNAYEWMLHYNREQSPVPVTGLLLTAQAGNQTIELHWQTQTEENNKGFSVERSSDGVHFSSISFVPSVGNTGLGNSYSYSDPAPLPATNYYRLKQTDKDGRSTYSKIVTAIMNPSSGIKVFPNPVHDLLTIQSTTPLIQATLQIYDAQGKLCKQTILMNSQKVDINVNHLVKGVYNARILAGGKTLHFIFVKN